MMNLKEKAITNRAAQSLKSSVQVEFLRSASVFCGMRSGEFALGIECGGTRTVAILANRAGDLIQRFEAGPANIRLISDELLARHFSDLASRLPAPSALGVGMAGAREEQDRERVRKAAASAWPGVPCSVTHDLETALLAGPNPPSKTAVRIVLISGTGSCCFGRHANKKTAKLGGWGHILGDKGSGYEIALRALKAVVYYYDRDGVWSALGRKLLRTLQLNRPDDLMSWIQTAGKSEVAALAVDVFDLWEKRDRIAEDILSGAVSTLSRDAVLCARRLAKPDTRIQVILAGSVLMKQPRFAARVRKAIEAAWPAATVVLLEKESAWGAVALALAHPTPPAATPEWKVRPALSASLVPPFPPKQLPLTEERNPRSHDLDKLSIEAGVELMLSEDQMIPAILSEHRRVIARAVRLIAAAFRSGGRLFYFGAGTSGRLGVLDASECPPTFRTPPDQVQGIIAGGQRALWQAVEGAEDDPEAGAAAVRFRGVGKRDIVVGIAASGRTPFVWGALTAASDLGAKTILLCFDPGLKVPPQYRPSLVIQPGVGPEILTGSTRLKAGTATKLILNILTTLSMVQTGKVASNLMIDLNPSNVKLRARAIRIVQELTGQPAETCEKALEESGWVVKKAWERVRSET